MWEGRGISVRDLGDQPNGPNDLVLILKFLFPSIIAQINPQNNSKLLPFSIFLWDPTPERFQGKKETKKFILLLPITTSFLPSIMGYIWELKD